MIWGQQEKTYSASSKGSFPGRARNQQKARFGRVLVESRESGSARSRHLQLHFRFAEREPAWYFVDEIVMARLS
jgi:hypothetical protein